MQEQLPRTARRAKTRDGFRNPSPLLVAIVNKAPEWGFFLLALSHHLTHQLFSATGLFEGDLLFDQ